MLALICKRKKTNVKKQQKKKAFKNMFTKCITDVSNVHLNEITIFIYETQA